MRIEEYRTEKYFRKITYDGDIMVEWEDNWGNGEHYKLVDGKWKALKLYTPLVIIQRKRKHNTWDK